MRLVFLFAFVGCGQQQAVAVDAPIDVAAPPTCSVGQPPAACSTVGDYCYAGELAAGTYYPEGANVQEGCNAPPTSCGSCDCLMQYFSPGFCSCEATDGGAFVNCSLI